MGTRDRLAPLRAALAYVQSFRVAVDVGANVGRWSLFMAEKFEHVVAFEPMQESQAAWNQRMAGFDNAMLVPSALGDYDGRCRMEVPEGNLKYSRAVPDDAGDVDMFTLDSIGLTNLDFLKVDCEGGDTAVLLGAIETIRLCKPVVIVESVPEHEARYGLIHGTPIRLMETFGYHLAETVWVDNILVYPRN